MEHAANTHDEEQYIVQNQKQIVQILNDLAKNHEMLKVTFGHDSCLTSVISVDVTNHALYLDVGIDDAFNNRLAASHQVVFTKEEGVKVKWTSVQVALTSLKDGKAIKITLPQSLVRVQRREFFRLTTPIVNPVPCVIPIVNEAYPDADKIIELSLVDISLGGISVLASDPLDELLVIGASFNQCKISFPDVGETSLTLQVRNITPMTIKDGVIKHRIGLQFISPSRGNEGLINRYVYHLERQAMAAAGKV